MLVIRANGAIALVSAVLFFSTAAIAAQGSESNPEQSSNNDEGRAAYVLSKRVRDGLLFWQLIHALSRTDASIDLIMSEMVLTNEEARDFQYLLRSTSRFIKSEESGVDQRIACETGDGNATDDEAYGFLEQIFDEKAKIAERHLQLMKKDLGASRSQKLADWLKRRETETSVRRPNYREILERRGISPGTVITRICGDVSSTRKI